MGLKTTNYKAPTGDVIETAYAIFDDIRKLSENRFRAFFKIYRDRDAANHVKAYDTKQIDFIWDRKQDLVSMAYAASKEPIPYEDWNDETQSYIVKYKDNIFTGWDNHIVNK